MSFFAIQPLLHSGFFPMHDDQQIARLFEMNKSLLAGQFPVRWVQDLGFGYGYPLFNFYPPLTYYLGEIFHLGGLGYIDSTKLIWAIAFVGSATAMYFLSKEFFGKVGGVVSAIFYLYAPYHAIDAYVRGAQAELFSFVWLPLVLLFAYKLTQGKETSKYIFLTGIGLALLMLTHNLVFLPFVGFVTIWYFAFAVTTRRDQLARFAFYFLLYTALCFALSAFFWAPSLAEKQYTLVDQLLIKNLASYKIHFVCPSQLWDSPWGFGGSIPGCLDGLSFKVGKSHVVLAILGGFSALYFWYKRDSKSLLISLLSFALFIAALFMTIHYSSFVWDNLSLLWYLQFPWRFLEFSALFSSLLAGAVVIVVKNKSAQLIVGSVLLCALLVQSVKLFVPQFYQPTMSDSELTSDTAIKWHVSSTSFEYLPKGVKTVTLPSGALGVDIDQSRTAKGHYQVLSGAPNISTAQFSPNAFRLNLNSSQPSVLQFNIVNFPIWMVWMDGQPLSTYDTNAYKLVTVTVPAGSHILSGKFVDTPIRLLANSVTIVTALALIIFYGTYRIKKQSR